MSNSKIEQGFIYATLGLVILYMLYENNKQKQRNDELLAALNSNNLISEKIKQQLVQLTLSHPNLDEDVKSELQQIATLIGLQQETVAILKLAKIIENLLKRLFKTDVDFKDWMKGRPSRKPQFADYLEYAHHINVIPKEDYHLISILKLIRNEEAHELNVIKDKSKLIGCFISGVGITISLYQLTKKAPAPDLQVI